MGPLTELPNEGDQEVFRAMRSWWLLQPALREKLEMHMDIIRGFLGPLPELSHTEPAGSLQDAQGAFCSSHRPPLSADSLLLDCKWLSISEVLCLLCQYKLVSFVP